MSEKTEKFYENGLRFECKRCSFCCGHSPGFVYLSKRDLDSLCKALKLKYFEFIKKYCRKADYYYGRQVLALLEKSNYDCILWENGCSVYEARPVQCSTYPFWSWMIKDEDSWNECSKDCMGMNDGRLWSKEEIEKAKTSYDKNRPMFIEEVEELLKNEK